MIAFRRTHAIWLLAVAWITVVFLLGGSSRDDVASLVVLRPLSVLLLGFALATTTRDIVARNAVLILAVASLPIVAALQLIPLPPSIWRHLPGREIVVEIDRVAGLGAVWRPLSLVPYRTVNAFWSGIGPIAFLLLLLALPRKRDVQLLIAMLIVVFVSVVLEVLQLAGGSDSAFYFYRGSGMDSATGLFSNRNHQAMLLAMAFPMLAAWIRLLDAARQIRRTASIFALLAGILMLPFLIATGSRTGLVLGTFGIVASWWVYCPGKRRFSLQKLQRWHLGAIVAVTACAVALFAFAIFGLASSPLQRLISHPASTDLRFRVWPTVKTVLSTYFPVGSGYGTFVEVFKIAEPDRDLRLTYLNHAHSDWAELVLTGGLAGVATILAGIYLFVRGAWHRFPVASAASPQETVLARLAGVLIAILMIGSLYDYPLRTPAMGAVLMIAAAWLCGQRRS